MRATIVGECNPHPSHFPLVPYPRNSSGWRLWQMLRSRTGASEWEYQSAFTLVNLCRAEWDDVAAAGAAKGLWQGLERGDTVLLLGEKVRRAMGVAKMLIHPVVVRGIVFRQVPHPSGRCLFYNDPTMRELVSVLMEELYERRG